MESTMGERIDFPFNRESNKKLLLSLNEHFFLFLYVPCVQAISNNLGIDF
jgi:hypothetical protein